MTQGTSAADRLQSAGFRFIPIEPGAKLPLKVGETRRGIDSSQPNLDGIDPEWYGAIPPLGYVVVDFDTKNGRDGWAEFCAAHEEPPQGWVVKTPSGGRHVYLRVPGELGVIKNTPIIAGAVDVRGQRGYVLGPGSHGYELLDEDLAEIPECPDWMLGLFAFERSAPAPSVNGHARATSRRVPPEPLDDEEWSDLAAALVPVPSDDYHTWVRVGHALAMAAPLERARDLWLKWSARSLKFEPRTAEKKWLELERTANGDLTHRTVYRMGMECGWPNERKRAAVELRREQREPDSAEVELGLKDALASSATPTQPFPWASVDRVLEGPLFDAVEWVEACNPRSLRLAALAAALTGMSGALMRRAYVQWAPGSAARPSPIQQPMIVVARSGAGKDAPLRCAARMVQAAGYTSLPGLPFHQTTLYAELVRSQGALVLNLDEVDGTLASLHGRSEHAAAKEAAIKTMLSSGEHLAAPIVSATNPQRLAIESEFGAQAWTGGVARPALGVFGVATRNVWDRLAGNVAGGLVGRMLILDADAPLTDFRPPSCNSTDMPGSVQEWIERLNPPGIAGSYAIGSDPEALLAIFEPDRSALAARDVVGAYLTQMANDAVTQGKEHLADLAARGIEAVMRLAAEFALLCAMDPLGRDAVIGERHVYAAADVVIWCILRTAGETSQREDLSHVGRAIRVIRDRLSKDYQAPRGGGPSPWHYRVRVTRGIEASAELALKALESSGEVVVDKKRLALAARVMGGS